METDPEWLFDVTSFSIYEKSETRPHGMPVDHAPLNAQLTLMRRSM